MHTLCVITVRLHYRLVVDGDPSVEKAMEALESMPGMNTPDALASVICPPAPRRRGGPHADG